MPKVQACSFAAESLVEIACDDDFVGVDAGNESGSFDSMAVSVQFMNFMESCVSISRLFPSYAR